MPPSALIVDNTAPSPLCCGAFDFGEIEIEVQDLYDDITSAKSTQIVVSPGSKTDSDSNASSSPKLPLHDYLQSFGHDSRSLNRSLADSFDSTDEIVEGSNEMKLMKRVVDKQRANSENTIGQHRGNQNTGLQRQDSMSDTNSVNSNDVFVSVDSNEMEYLDVLDKHVKQSSQETRNNTHPELDTEDYPNKQIYQAGLDDIIEHLCAAPCGACLPDVDTIFDERTRKGYPKSVLRKPRYSSPDQYLHSSNYAGLNGQPILIRSSSEYNAKGQNDSFRAQHSVRFHNVDIRSFKMTLGNHPSATTGPPVMLDGELIEPNARKVMPLEKYEKQRPPRRKRRQLKLTLQQRHNILVKERGFSFEEVKGAWQESLQIRRQRKETLERGLAMMKWDEVWESTCRKFNRLVDSTL